MNRAECLVAFLIGSFVSPIVTLLPIGALLHYHWAIHAVMSSQAGV